MEYEEPLFFEVMQWAADAEADVIDMVSGNPDWGSPPGISAGLHEYADLGGDDFQYAPTDGLRELREEIASRRGVAVERVVVTNGGGMANTLGLGRALERDAGSEVVMTDPVYPYYPGKVSMLGGEQVFVPTESDGTLDPADVRAAASAETACIIVNSPNNPTGKVYREETVRELAGIAEEHDALLVMDEVYDHFDFTGEFVSALTLESPNVVVTNSYSKTFAITGFRVGYAIFPEEHVDAAVARNMLTNVATTRPGQYAVLHALRNTDPDYYTESRQILESRVDSFTSALDAAGAEYSTPEGAFYVLAKFPDFPGTLDNVRTLIEDAGVAGMPGTGFGESKTEWMRFALVTPRVEEAGERLAHYFA